MLTRRGFLIAGGAALTIPGIVSGGEAGLTAQDALQRVQNGSLILLDIRTPEEWRSTGVAPGAWPIDMRDADFGNKLLTTLANNPDLDVAIICRSGNRSGRLMDVLKENGIEGVLDVPEGMLGGPRGQGWIPRGLPVVSAQEAIASVPADLTVR